MKKLLFAMFLIGTYAPMSAQTDNHEDIDPGFTVTPEEEFGNDIDPGFTISPEEEGNAYPTLQHSVATKGFWSNWFVQAGADWTAFYSDEEQGLGLSKSPFKGFRSTPAMSLAIGKEITPTVALRLKMQGFWGRTVVSESSDRNKNHNCNFQLQPMLNLTNIFRGYSEKRIWNMSLFAGAGFNYNGKSELHTLSLSAGLHSSWRVSSHFRVYGEFGITQSERDADGRTIEKRRSNHLWKNHDNSLYAELGLQYSIGKSAWKKSADIDAINMLHQAEIDAINAQISDLKAENDRMKKMLEEREVEN